MKAAPMISLSRKSRPHPDAALLKRIGQTVRARLDADPAAYAADAVTLAEQQLRLFL